MSTATTFPGPISLEGRFVRLEPLRMAHSGALAQVAIEPAVWRYMSHSIESEDALAQWIAAAVAGRKAETMLPFATICKQDGQETVVGSTRFGALALEHRRAEIGWTFVAPAWQRTAVNTEAKYLMLRFAFEEWGLQRVELKTHSKNEKSRAAILRIGATEEGLLRKHMILGSGELRDTVYFSILDDEWPRVKKRLEERLYAD